MVLKKVLKFIFTEDLATIDGVKITTNVKQNIQWLTDRDHQTCNNDRNSHTVTIVWDTEYWFTWMRIVLKQSAHLKSIDIQLNQHFTSQMLNCSKFILNTSNPTLEIHCSLEFVVRQITITAAADLCDIYISGGVNFALKQMVAMSSVAKNYYATNAVDGDLNTASITRREKRPYLLVTLPEPRLVNRVVLHCRKYNDQTLRDYLKYFELKGLDENNCTQFSYKDNNTAPFYIYSIGIAGKKMNKIFVYATEVTKTRDPTVTLREVEIYGECLPGTWGLSCNQSCPTKCPVSCTQEDGLCNLLREESECNVKGKGEGRELSPQQKLCAASQLETLFHKNALSLNVTDIKSIASVADTMEHFVDNGVKVSKNVTNSIVDILSAFGNKASDPDFIIDDTTFDKLVTLADVVTFSMQDNTTDAPEEDYVTINSLVTSLESVVLRLSSNETKDFAFVKNTIAVKIGTVSQGINFPEANHSGLKPFDNWFRNSKNEISLSKKAFDGYTEVRSYSVIAIKRKENDETESFQTNESSITSKPHIVSDVLAVSVGRGVTLKSPVSLTFRVPNVTKLDSHVTPQCVYLDTSMSGRVTWSREGCLTERFTDDQIICKCNHLTSFAVLMGPKQLAEHQAMTALTITGCSVSIVCLIITIVIYLYFWRYVKNERSVLLLNLCVCMLISYLVFLLGIDKTDNQILCQFIGIFLHYSFLCVFFNFLSQSLALYKSIYSVSGRVRLELFLPVTYITPLLIVGATALVNQAEGYGTPNYCWLSVNKGFIWAFIGPVICVLLVNSGVLIAVIKTIQSTHSMIDKSNAERTMSAARTIVVLTPLFGLTWTFGIVSLLTDVVVLQYLFVIFNTFQGLFIFVFYCLRQRQIIEAILQTKRQRQAQSTDRTNKPQTASTY
ncbi:adhesion G protein-coupled receptor E2 [Biomphalaria glabrata]|nr:adhesion G protein-coupled receptor E2-like [Biomphalaria glabrata]